jgi:outer membrane biogenesis lipoprotein LolB
MKYVMNRVLLVLSSMALLTACQTQDDRTTEQRQPQFGQPESTIPWNKPESWEQGGALGAMPGLTQPH